MATEKADKVAREKAVSGERAAARELRCFIIMPFAFVKFTTPEGEQRSLNERKLKHIYEALFKKAVESYDRKNVRFRAHRYVSQRGNFVKGIVSHLDNADLVIADLTGLNPNVFYELGIRHTLRCGTLMLTQNKKELASDLSNYIAVEYKYPQQSDEFDDYYPEFERRLHDAIDEVLDEPSRPDNPVRDFIGDRNIFRNEQRIKEIRGNIERMELVMVEYVRNVVALGRRLESWASGANTLLLTPQNTAEPFLTRLVVLNENMDVVSFVRDVVRDMRIIDYNQPSVIHEVERGDPEQSRKIEFGFRDASRTLHHILDLHEYYKRIPGDAKSADLMKAENVCPVVMSFKKFIEQWEKELEELTK